MSNDQIKICLESIGEGEVRLYRSDQKDYSYLVYVTPGHAGKFADAVNQAISDSNAKLQSELTALHEFVKLNCQEEFDIWQALRKEE